MKRELKAGRLLRPFMLDVGARLVEKYFPDEPEAKPFLVSSFVDFLARTKDEYDASKRRRMHKGMWEQLADMVYEGAWLAKRLQLLLAPAERSHHANGEGEMDEGDEGEVTSQSEVAASEARVHKALVEMLKLLDLPDVGTAGWEAAVREHKGITAGATVPLRPALLQAWVEGEGSGLRELVRQCTPELAEQRLSGRGWWCTEYKKKNSRMLGNDLTSTDLYNTGLPKYLISTILEKCVWGASRAVLQLGCVSCCNSSSDMNLPGQAVGCG